jgi:hypothetical protein
VVLQKDPDAVATRVFEQKVSPRRMAGSATSGSGSSQGSSSGSGPLSTYTIHTFLYTSEAKVGNLATNLANLHCLGEPLLTNFVNELTHLGMHVHAVRWQGELAVEEEFVEPITYIGPKAIDQVHFPYEFDIPTDQYATRAKFPYYQVSILPTLVYQTRNVVRECPEGTFAQKYVNQKSQEGVPIFGLNAAKATDVMRCMDPKTMSSATYDPEIQTDGYDFAMSKDKVFAEFVPEDATRWSRIGWLDALTKEVEMATMIYTSGEEVFTLIKVHIKRTYAGGLDVSYELISVADLDSRDMKTVARLDAILCLVFTILGGLVCIKDYVGGNWTYANLYAIVMRVWMAFFCVKFMVNVMEQKSMSHEFILLLNAFLDGGGHGAHGGMHATIEHFFDVMVELDVILVPGYYKQDGLRHCVCTFRAGLVVHELPPARRGFDPDFVLCNG